jgi:hypothetical protein
MFQGEGRTVNGKDERENLFLDYLKEIVILLVLVDHSVQYGSGASLFRKRLILG